MTTTIDILDIVSIDKISVIKNTLGHYNIELQYDGPIARNTEVVGYISNVFKSDLPYFKSTYWHDTYDRYSDVDIEFPSTLVFNASKYDFKYPNYDDLDDNHLSNEEWLEITDSISSHNEKILQEHGVTCSQILKDILQEVNSKTGEDYELDFEEHAYGLRWFEGYIPLKLGNEKFTLTWFNY